MLLLSNSGTLLAILTTFITYIAYGLIIAAVTVPNASGNEMEYNVWRYGYNNSDHGNISTNLPLFTDCSVNTLRNNISGCEFGSANDQQVCVMYFLRLTVSKTFKIRCISGARFYTKFSFNFRIWQRFHTLGT
jgi:hypothetical protein